MPRTSAAAATVAAFAVPEAPMEAPRDLTAEQRADWDRLIGAFPGRFSADDVPLLVELMRAQSVARVIAAELETMRTRSLTASTKAGNAARSVYLQLAAAARDQSRVITSLAVKLRLAQQTKVRKITAERERARSPSGPRPWDATERH
jgi:hypothetical protein